MLRVSVSFFRSLASSELSASPETVLFLLTFVGYAIFSGDSISPDAFLLSSREANSTSCMNPVSSSSCSSETMEPMSFDTLTFGLRVDFRSELSNGSAVKKFSEFDRSRPSFAFVVLKTGMTGGAL